MAEPAPPACLDCGQEDPPPEMTCDGGTPGGILRDHFVGTEAGCQYCGRLVQACAARPCQAVRAMRREIEDDARACLARGEPDVLYRPLHGEHQHGVITSVTEAWVFVRYGTQATPEATDPADLEALTPEQARRWRFRAPLRIMRGDGNGRSERMQA